jgi:hypothetical protein
MRHHRRKEAARRQLTEDGNVEISGRDLREPTVAGKGALQRSPGEHLRQPSR